MRGTTALVSVLAALSAGQGFAQEATEAEVIGTVILGESKREVQADTATSTTVINEEEIEERQASTIAELIDSVPGVALVNGTTVSGSGINIRGFGANGTYGSDQKVLIQVDGASKGSEELYRIGTQLYTDPSLYKEVEVIRGTVGSFAYGSGAIGGVVLMETKDAGDFTGGEIGSVVRQTLSFNSNGTGVTSSTILAWQPSDTFEALANLTYRYSDGPQEDGSGADLTTKGQALPSGLLKGKFTFGDNLDQSITASIAYTETEELDVPYDSFGAVNFGNVDRYTKDTTASVLYRWNPADNDLINFSARLTYSDQEIEQTSLAGANATLDADHRYQTTKLTLNNDAYFKTGTLSHDLKAGVEFIHKERLDASSAPGGTDDRFALYAVDEMRWGGLTLTPALRYEQQRVGGPLYAYYNNDALMGGLSARYEWNSGFAVFASAAYTESLPIMDDLTNTAYMTQSEKAQSYEVGVSYANLGVLRDDDKMSAKLTAFTNNVWDITSYSGVSNVSMTGVEAEVSYAWGDGFYVDFNGTVMDGSNDTPGAASTIWNYTQADNVRFSIGRSFADGLVDANWEVVHHEPFTNSSGTIYESFTVHNLGISYNADSGWLEGTEVRFAVENVFDELYRPNLYTRNAPGRTYKLTLAKTF